MVRLLEDSDGRVNLVPRGLAKPIKEKAWIMVDCENMSLHSVSRRKVLAGVAATPLSPATADHTPSASTDPILPFWREWQRLNIRASVLCHRWQRLESHMMRAVGVPQVTIPSLGDANAVRALSHAEIDRAVADYGCPPNIADELHADFAGQQARWDAEAARIGFEEAKHQEGEAWEQEAVATDAIFRIRAATLAGVEIKIALLIKLCFSGCDDPDFPLPQLRSTLADVKRLRRSLDALRC